MKIKCVSNIDWLGRVSDYLTVGKIYDYFKSDHECGWIIGDVGHKIYTRIPGESHGKFEVLMNKDEYRNAYMESGMRTAAWCKYLDISEYQHRNYQNGRTVVPEMVAVSAKQLVVLSLAWSVK